MDIISDTLESLDEYKQAVTSLVIVLKLIQRSKTNYLDEVICIVDKYADSPCDLLNIFWECFHELPSFEYIQFILFEVLHRRGVSFSIDSICDHFDFLSSCVQPTQDEGNDNNRNFEETSESSDSSYGGTVYGSYTGTRTTTSHLYGGTGGIEFVTGHWRCRNGRWEYVRGHVRRR